MENYYEKTKKGFRKIKGYPFRKFVCKICKKEYYTDGWTDECYRNAEYCKECQEIEDKKNVKEQEEMMRKKRAMWKKAVEESEKNKILFKKIDNDPNIVKYNNEHFFNKKPKT